MSGKGDKSEKTDITQKGERLEPVIFAAADSSLDFSLVKNCDANAYDAIPKVVIKIDIPRVLALLTESGYLEVADAGVMCVVEKDGVESTIYSGGRILVKTNNERVAGEVAAEIFAAISPILE